MATVTLEDVTVDFMGVRALSDISMTLGEHRVTGVIGPNGAGKTTLLNVVTGFIPPTRGRIWLDTQRITSGSPDRLARRGVVRTWQAGRLFESLSVRDNVAVAGTSFRQTAERIDELIDMFGLKDVAALSVDSLSLGARRMVVFARAFASDPRLVLLDEPFAGLDVEEKASVGTFLRELAEQMDIGVVLVEHDVPILKLLADHLVVLDAGRLLMADRPERVLRDERVIEAYFGESF